MIKTVFHTIFLQVLGLFIVGPHRQSVTCFFPRWIETVVSSVFNNTLTHSPFRVTEKLRPKISDLQLSGFGTKQTCLLSLNEFKFFILKIATTACPGCNFTFPSKNRYLVLVCYYSIN